MKTIIYSLLLILMFVGNIVPQKYLERKFKTYNNPDELVTLSQSLPFKEAIALLSKVSESTTGKRIVSTIESSDPIGIEIQGMPYDKAMYLIVQYNGYILEEKEDVIIIKRVTDDEKKKSATTYASVDSREVKISALFFEMDVAESRKRGIDWEILLSGRGINLGSKINQQTEKLTGDETTTPADFNVTGSGVFNVGNFAGDATALFRFFENENVGEIIASPNIVVRDRVVGRIQVGSDFSVRTRDFAGNTVEKFFPTGTIIEVSPYIYNENGVDYVLLDLNVERSTFQLNELTTEIRKTTAKTQILSLNGEESVLGGLFVNEDKVVRNGIPFLKDLPWWVFGIRYLTGSDTKETAKKELVILLKTEILPSLKDRLTNPVRDNILKKDIEHNNNRIKYYRMMPNTENVKEE